MKASNSEHFSSTSGNSGNDFMIQLARLRESVQAIVNRKKIPEIEETGKTQKTQKIYLMSDLHVDDKYRKNSLSLEDGGSLVAITYENGKRFLYDKIKSPKKYIKMISDRGNSNGFIVLIQVDGREVWSKERGGDPWNF